MNYITPATEPDQVHNRCPKEHEFEYVTSKGFAWCNVCKRFSPVTIAAFDSIEELKAKGVIHPGIDQSFVLNMKG